MTGQRVERLVRAYVLVDHAKRRAGDPKLVRLQAAMDQVRAQLSADEQCAFVTAVQAYWRERHEKERI